jgi:hypothetical protein
MELSHNGAEVITREPADGFAGRTTRMRTHLNAAAAILLAAYGSAHAADKTYEYCLAQAGGRETEILVCGGDEITRLARIHAALLDKLASEIPKKYQRDLL